jgi:hypothetical protein
MTEGIDRALAEIAKKVDDQARFTRGVVVVCTLSILGVIFYTLTSTISTLPDLILAKFMGNMERVDQEWRLIEAAQNRVDRTRK